MAYVKQGVHGNYLFEKSQQSPVVVVQCVRSGFGRGPITSRGLPFRYSRWRLIAGGRRSNQVSEKKTRAGSNVVFL